MQEKGLYYITEDFKNLVKSVGGEWNDTKKRPIICLIKSHENNQMYWAIPMGKFNHRDAKQIVRLQRYLDYPDKDIRSCYYHVGRTTAKSIFFISDAVPITDKYILSEHCGKDGVAFVLKNPKLSEELERKLSRILSFENTRPNHFRQHITAIKEFLLNELLGEKNDSNYNNKNR